MTKLDMAATDFEAAAGALRLRRALSQGRAAGGVDAARRRPRDARLGGAEAERRAAHELPAGIGGGRRRARALLHHRHRPRRRLARLRRQGRDQPPAADRPRRLRGREAADAAVAARAAGAVAHRAAGRPAADRRRRASATWATTPCGWSSTCPTSGPTRSACPTACSCARRVMVVFDAVKDEMIVVTPVYPQPSVDAQAAYAAAVERLRGVVAALDEPLPHATTMSGVALALPTPVSNTTPDEFMAMVARAKEYIAAGDIFQVVLAQRFAAPFSLPSFALYRALRRTNPSPFLFYLDFGGVRAGRLLARDPGARARRRGDDPAARRHAPARRHAGGGQGAGGGAARRPQGARRAPDAARPRPQRRRPRRRDRHGARHRELRGRALQPRHAHRQPRASAGSTSATT